MYDVPADQIFAWTDSEIVLCWLCRPPAAWKTFVSHRVAEIQQAVSSNKWRHVRSQDNPANLISHGVQPKALANSALWWDGPDWLKQQPEKWPTQKIMTPMRIPEAKIPALLVTVTSTPDPFWSKYSSYSHLTQIMAKMHRFLRTPYERITEDVLMTDELGQAKTQLLLVFQKETYPEVFEWLTSGKEIPTWPGNSEVPSSATILCLYREGPPDPHHEPSQEEGRQESSKVSDTPLTKVTNHKDVRLISTP